MRLTWLAPSGWFLQICASRCSQNALSDPVCFYILYKTFSKLLKFILRNTLLCGWFLKNSYIQIKKIHDYEFVRAAKHSELKKKQQVVYTKRTTRNSINYLHHLMNGSRLIKNQRKKNKLLKGSLKYLCVNKGFFQDFSRTCLFFPGLFWKKIKQFWPNLKKMLIYK